MPIKKAAIKYLRKSAKRDEKNALVKRNIKELIKKIRKATETKVAPDKMAELTKSLQKAVDRAVKSGVLKANTANRKKSRIAKAIKKVK